MVMINLFVGVMVTSLSEAQAESLRSKLDIDEIGQHELRLEKTVENIEDQLAELKRLIESQKGKT